MKKYVKKFVAILMIVATLISVSAIAASAASYVTIYYNTNGAKIASFKQIVKAGSSFIISQTIPFKNGYMFLGWGGAKNNTTATVGPGAAVYANANTTLYAVYQKGVVKTNYVTNAPTSSSYMIPLSNTDMCMDAEKAVRENAKILIYENSGSANQRFKLKYVNNGYYQIVSSENTNLALTLTKGWIAENMGISLTKSSGSNSQLFRVIMNRNYYMFQSKMNGAYYLTAKDGSLVACHYTGGNNQCFKFNSVIMKKISMNSSSAYSVINQTASTKAKFDKIINEYPSGSYWTGTFDGGSTCYGFGKMVIYRLFSTYNGRYRTWDYSGNSKCSMKLIAQTSNFSTSSIKSLMSKARCGDVLQFGPYSQHTQIIYQVKENSVIVYDCNCVAKNKVSLREVSFGNMYKSSSMVSLLRAA